MSEIWSLTTLCRCCHTDGQFKSLSLVYHGAKGAEIYEDMLRETLGVTLYTAPLEASYTICDECIKQLKAAADFKEKVLICDQKFKIYCTNEQFLSGQDVVKVEVEDGEDHRKNDSDSCHEDFDNDEDLPPVDVEVKQEFNIEVDINNPVQNTNEIKDEEEKPPSITQIKVKNKVVKKRITQKEPNDKQASQKKNFKTVKIEKENGEKRAASEEINPVKKKIKTKEEENVSTPKKEKEETASKDYVIVKQTENGLQYACRICNNNKLYSKRVYAVTHIRRVHDQFRCKKCSKNFFNELAFEKHICSPKKPDKIVKCELCSKFFKNENLLISHRFLIHINKDKFTCDICGKDLINRSTMIRHLNWHQGLNKKELCDLCGWAFNDSSNLRIHIRTVHENLRPFKCNFCDKTYKAKKHLKEHLVVHSLVDISDKTENSDKNQKSLYFECDICHKKYRSQHYMESHRLTHQGVFPCAFCKERFESREAKIRHLGVKHTKYYQCFICSKEYSSSYALNRHIERHNGISKFSCDICQRGFGQKHSLIRHKLRMHSNNQMKMEFVSCEVCKKKVRNLSKHMLSHNARIHACDLCDKTYPANNNLNRHKEAVHYGRSFICEVCNKKYIQRAKLITHRKKKHKLETELPEDCEKLLGIVKNDEWVMD